MRTRRVTALAARCPFVQYTHMQVGPFRDGATHPAKAVEAPLNACMLRSALTALPVQWHTLLLWRWVLHNMRGVLQVLCKLHRIAPVKPSACTSGAMLEPSLSRGAGLA